MKKGEVVVMAYNFQLKKLDNNTFELLLTNIWKKESLTQNIKALEKFDIPINSKLIVDFQNLKECDSSAIIYLISFFKGFKEENLTIKNLNSFGNSIPSLAIIFKKAVNKFSLV